MIISYSPNYPSKILKAVSSMQRDQHHSQRAINEPMHHADGNSWQMPSPHPLFFFPLQEADCCFTIHGCSSLSLRKARRCHRIAGWILQSRVRVQVSPWHAMVMSCSVYGNKLKWATSISSLNFLNPPRWTQWGKSWVQILRRDIIFGQPFLASGLHSHGILDSPQNPMLSLVIPSGLLQDSWRKP